MAYRKLKLAALMSICALAGIAGGGLGTAWLFFHVYGNAGDFAAGRAVDASRLLIDGHGRPYSQADVYRNAMRSMRRKTVEAGLTFGSIENPGYPAMLRQVLAKLSRYPGLYADNAIQDAGSPDIYSAGTANAVRACIMREHPGTPRQVNDCAIAAVRRAAQAQATGIPPTRSPTASNAAAPAT
jgi:hypothetical protein